VCITANQLDVISNPDPNNDPNATTARNIQLSVVTRLAYPEKFIRDQVVAPLLQLSVFAVPYHVRLDARKTGIMTLVASLNAERGRNGWGSSAGAARQRQWIPVGRS